MQNSLAIIGAGRVGQALGRRLRELGWKIGAVVTRTESSARKAVRFIGAGQPQTGASRAVLASRVILIATPDDEISAAAQELARMGGEELHGKVVLHTSGARGACALNVLTAQGAAVGSMHPLQSFSGFSVPSLEGRVFAVEGDTQAVLVARRIARAHRGKQEAFVSRGGGDGCRAGARGGGSSHSVTRLGWDEATRIRARVVASDAAGSREF